MTAKKWAVVSDFDGTITSYDVGDTLCMRFAAVTPQELAASYNPDMNIENWMRTTFNKMTHTPKQINEFIVTDVKYRNCFPEFFDKAKKNGMPFIVTSGGLSVYIEPLLNKWKIKPDDAFYGSIKHNGSDWECDYSFLGSLRLDEFKAKAVTDMQKKGYKVAFFGDGPSDVLALKKSDAAFAREKAYSILMSDEQQVKRLNLSLFELSDFCVPINFFNEILKA